MEPPNTLQARKRTCFLTHSHGDLGTLTLPFKSGFHLRKSSSSVDSFLFFLGRQAIRPEFRSADDADDADFFFFEARILGFAAVGILMKCSAETFALFTLLVLFVVKFRNGDAEGKGAKNPEDRQVKIEKPSGIQKNDVFSLKISLVLLKACSPVPVCNPLVPDFAPGPSNLCFFLRSTP